jgi:pimeloyl-ACP methyl ester carboxylesterase
MAAARFPIEWARGYVSRAAGDLPNTYTALYSMKKLLAEGYINKRDENGLLLDANLSDFWWEVTWTEDFETPDEDLPARFAEAQGYAIFIHGWTGNHTIFEALPGMVVTENRRLIAISVDHNGFGKSSFLAEPAIERCNPPAAMYTLERWIDAIKIRRQRGDSNPRTINLIGHSMGGATLFYANPIKWNFGELTRYSLAPALLLEDEIKQAFYSTLGLAIELVNRIPAFELIERAIKPRIISTLCAGASDYIKQAHDNQYRETPRGTTAATLTAMGVLRDWEIPRNFDLMRVMLSHRDALVGLTPMIDLVCTLEFPSANVRVVPGSHYMFSVGRDSAFQHAQNRDLVIEDILMLHNRAYEMQKSGRKVG